MGSLPSARAGLSVSLIAALLGALPATAQVVHSPNGPSRALAIPGPRESLIPAGGVAVPMPRFQNIPHVEAYVNGKGPYRFVVDTGAPLFCLNNSLAEDLKLPGAALAGASGARVVVRSPGGDGRPATPHEVETLKIGDAEFHGVPALASDSPFSRDFDGVLGLAVFRDCLLTYDYRAGKLRLERGELPPANGQDILDYDTRMGKLFLPAEVDGQPFDFALDTGASAWFVFPKALTKQRPYVYGPVPGHKARTIDRAIVVQMARLASRLKLGQHTFERPYGFVEGDTDLAVIGSGALDEFALTIDQANKRLRLARASGTAIVPPPYRMFGFGMLREGDTIKVNYVVPKSPAEQAGLKEGDVILALADKPAAEIYGRPIMKELAQKASIKVRYTPANASEPREIEVPICELIP